MNLHDIIRAAGGAIVGAALTWGASGLVEHGRVTSLESSIARIELRLDQLVAATVKRD